MRLRILRYFSYGFLLLLSYIPGKAQGPDSVKIEQLNQQVIQLTQLILQRDSAEYVETMDELMNGFHNSYMLHSKIRELEKDIINDQSTIALLNINNPGTAQMVRQFETHLKELVISKLSTFIGDNVDKKTKLMKTLDDIFNNPFVSPILRSNPVTGAISTAFNFLTGLLDPQVKMEKNLTGAVKHVSVELSNIIDKNILGGLTNDLIPYVRFFDTLYMINTRFNSRLAVLRSQSIGLANAYKPVWQFYISQGLKPEVSPVEKQKLFDQLFPEIKAGSLQTYNNFLQRNETRQAKKNSSLVKEYFERYNELIDDYNNSLGSFKSDYIAVLAAFKNKLPLYATALENSYQELTKEPVVVSSLIMQSGGNETRQQTIDPVQEKVYRTVWSYNYVDTDTRNSLKTIF